MARHAPLRSSRKEPDAVVDGARPERPMPKFDGRATPRAGTSEGSPAPPTAVRARSGACEISEAAPVVALNDLQAD
jgi:hypothetical protein